MLARPEEGQSSPRPKPKRSPLKGAVFIVLAVAIAVSAAYLLTRYMDARTQAVRVPTAPVVVAQVDIPVATPIKPEWLTTIEWPLASKPEGAAQDPAFAVGRVAVNPISRGEAVLPNKLAKTGSGGGLSTLVPASMRAAAVRVDDVVGVAGFIHPGDSVDVLVTMRAREGLPTISKIILENVKVLAVGKEIDPRASDKERARAATVATLMVSAEDSERLWLAATEGKLLLTLRGFGDDEYAETHGITAPVLLAGAPVPEPPATPVAVVHQTRRVAPKKERVAVQEPKTEKQTVEILRGDLFEKRDFATPEDKRR